MSHERLGFLGVGRVGATLALGLERAERTVAATWTRSHRTVGTAPALPEPQDVLDACDVIFLTVPDGRIAPLAEELRWSDRHLAVHCAGALDLDVLNAARRAGARTASLHPLQTFTEPDETLGALRGAAFTVEGDEGDVAFLTDLALALGGRPTRLPPGTRALYHASAQYVGAFLTTLLHESVTLWHAMGVPQEDALAALVPLAEGTLRGVRRVGPVEAFAGPLSRGDDETVRRHLHALSGTSEGHLDLYRDLSRRALDLARRRGLDDERTARLEALLGTS